MDIGTDPELVAEGSGSGEPAEYPGMVIEPSDGMLITVGAVGSAGRIMSVMVDPPPAMIMSTREVTTVAAWAIASRRSMIMGAGVICGPGVGDKYESSITALV